MPKNKTESQPNEFEANNSSQVETSSENERNGCMKAFCDMWKALNCTEAIGDLAGDVAGDLTKEIGIEDEFGAAALEAVASEAAGAAVEGTLKITADVVEKRQENNRDQNKIHSEASKPDKKAK